MSLKRQRSYQIKRVCIVGGGHAAHTLAALLPSKGIECNLFTAFGDEAKRINEGIQQQGYIEAEFASHLTPSGIVRGKPSVVSNDPSVACKDCDVFLLPLPSFAYKDVLKQILPYVDRAFIGATPGQGGFDWLGKEILKEKNATLFAVVPMPFNCRVSQFGKRVEVQQYEERYWAACTPLTEMSNVVDICNAVFGETRSAGHFLAATLWPLNANIHPAHLYNVLKDYKAGETTWDENPIFYESMKKETGLLMHATSDDVQKICVKLRSAGIEVQVPTIFESEVMVDGKRLPGYENIETVDEFFSTYAAYKGFRSPFKKLENGKWIPDFDNRYFTEDIPFSLVLWKGLALIVDVETPTIDKLILWAQAHMKKEYLKEDAKTLGRDVIETTAPQEFGLRTIDDLKKFYL